MASRSSTAFGGSGVDQPVLRNLTGKCLDLLDRCLWLEGSSGKQAAWFENCQARLRWWAFGLKAQSLGRSSLDRRLSHRLDVRDAIADILTGLSEALCDYIAESRSMGLGKDNDSDSDDGHSDASSPISIQSGGSDASSNALGGFDGQSRNSGGSAAHYAYFIEMSLNSLLRLSVLIRKAGDKLRYKRADDDLRRIQQHAPETYAEFKTHLKTLILIGPSEHSLLTRLDPATTYGEIPQSVFIVIRAWINSRLGPIQERLVQANIIRRHRIMCSRKDARYATSVSAQAKNFPRPEAGATTRPSAYSARPLEAVRTAGRTQPELTPPVPIPRIIEEPSTVYTRTATGSELNSAAMRSGRSSSVVSKLTRTGQNQDYPKASIMDKSPLCPYCGFVLGLEYAKSEKKWHGHIAHDLRPYTCLFLDCNSPYNLYSTKEEWLEHMAASHNVTQWLCSECSIDQDQDDEVEVAFATETDYKKHMLESHHGSFDPIDLPLLLNLGERTVIEPVSCPLCLNDKSLVHIEHDEHIAIHLYSFSLRALPWDFDLDDGAASAGSSDSPPGPHYQQPHVEDSDDDDDDDEDTPLQAEALDNAIQKLVRSAENLVKPDSVVPAHLVNLLPGSLLWQALHVAHVDASQRQMCHLLVTRLRMNLEQLSTFGLEDDADLQDLNINIKLDIEALEARISQTARQDYDLWAEAFDTLSPAAKRTVERMIDEADINSRSVPEQLENLLMLSWDIQEKCNSRYGVGERQYADDMVESFQLIGDDETIILSPYTNLPWAVVHAPMKALAAIMQNGAEGTPSDTQQRIVLSCLRQLHLTLRALNRGRIYGFVYIISNTTEEALAELRFASLKLYTSVLEILITVNGMTKGTSHAFSQDIEARAIGRFRTISNELENAVGECEAALTQPLDSESARLLRETPHFREPEVPALSLENLTQNEEEEEIEDEAEQFLRLDRISDLKYREIQERLRLSRTPGTCEWLLQRSNFVSWETSDSNAIFWLEGSFGTGKTFLSSAVVDHIQQMVTNSPSPPGLAFFFCSELQAVDKNTAIPLLRSLIRQLTGTATRKIREISKFLGYRDDESLEDDVNPTADACKETLMTALTLHSRTFLVLDNIEALHPHALRSFVDTLTLVLESSTRPLKIFMSSRYSSVLWQFVKSSTAMAFHSTLPHWDPNDLGEPWIGYRNYFDTYFDIERFVRENDSNVALEAIPSIVRKSEGVFLWPSLSIKDTNSWDDAANTSYLRNFCSKITKDYGSFAEPRTSMIMKAFMVVYCACTPLTTNELGSALSIDPDDEGWLRGFRALDEAELRELWPDFLILDVGWTSGGRWRFSHSSLAESFAKKHFFGLESGLNTLTYIGHRDMAKRCLKLLLEARYDTDADESWGTSDANANILSPAHPLQIYARYYWANHLQGLEGFGSIQEHDPQLWELLTRFLGLSTGSKRHYEEWYQQLLRDGPLGLRPESTANRVDQPSLDFIAPGTSPVFSLVRFSLTQCLKECRENAVLDLSVTNKGGQTLLEVVADGKPESIAIACELVHLGANVNQPQKNDYGSALTHAVVLGDLEWFRFLLSQGADANANWGGYVFGSPLVAAAYHGNQELIDLLIQAGAYVNLPVVRGRFTSALAAATATRRPEILRILIGHGADVNIRNESYSPLVDLVTTGSIDCLRILIDAGADVRRTGAFGESSVHGNHPAGFAYEYPNALYAAASHGHISCLEVLIMAGALDPSLEEPLTHSGHALAITAASGNLTCVELLCSAGVDVNEILRSGHYGSGLAAAASEGHLSCVRALLDAGANADQVLSTGKYGSALTAAAKSGDTRCLLALLKAGANADQPLRAGNYGSALAAAAAHGHDHCVQVLLQAGANPNLRLPNKKNILGSALAASVGSESCMRLLIGAGADINQGLPSSDNGEGGSALAIAAERGLLKSLEILIDAGADVNLLHKAEGLRCGSALVAASFTGSLEVLLALIAVGAEIDQEVSVGFYGNALIAAAGQGELDCMRALVAAGADVNKQVNGPPGRCRSALAAAAHMARPHCVAFLIQKGAAGTSKLGGPLEDALRAALAPVDEDERMIWELHNKLSWRAKKIADGKAKVIELLEKHIKSLEE